MPKPFRFNSFFTLARIIVIVVMSTDNLPSFLRLLDANSTLSGLHGLGGLGGGCSAGGGGGARPGARGLRLGLLGAEDALQT